MNKLMANLIFLSRIADVTVYAVDGSVEVFTACGNWECSLTEFAEFLLILDKERKHVSQH